MAAGFRSVNPTVLPWMTFSAGVVQLPDQPGAQWLVKAQRPEWMVDAQRPEWLAPDQRPEWMAPID